VSNDVNMDLFYWLFSSYFPELQLLDAKESRKKSLLQARPKSRSWLWVVFGLVFIDTLIMLTDNFRRLGVASWGARLALAALCGAPLMGAAHLLEIVLEFVFCRRRIRQRLRVVLVQEGIPICLACGYDLRGPTEPRCPECGQPFDAALLKPRAAAE
jgi:hypothetical protein